MEKNGPWVGRTDYSDDRMALAKEIRETLQRHLVWCPNTAGPDLITALGLAMEQRRELLEACKYAIRNVEAYAKREGGSIPFGCAPIVDAIAKAEGK